MDNTCQYKLLIVAPSGIHLRNFLERVENSASQIHIITTKPLIFKTRHPVTFVDFSLKNPKNYIRTPLKIRDIYGSFKPDIVHVHQLNSFAYYTVKALKRFDSPIVATAWGTDVLVSPSKSWVLRKMVKFILTHATAFTSDSAFMAQRMRDLVPTKKLDITVCNFGVAEPIYSLPKENVIYSNRLHKPLYRVDKIIEAFRHFRATSEGRTWKLVIAATGTETEKLKLLARDLGVDDAVIFAGWLEREANMEWYARSKVWVSIPETDATAISLLEAMYYGCYPVVADLPASHEWIKDSINGRIVDDVEATFLNGINQVNFEFIGAVNRLKIEKEGTYSIAEEKFRELHCNLLIEK